jgi:hypothetical protein
VSSRLKVILAYMYTSGRREGVERGRVVKERESESERASQREGDRECTEVERSFSQRL